MDVVRQDPLVNIIVVSQKTRLPLPGKQRTQEDKLDRLVEERNRIQDGCIVERKRDVS